MATRKAGPSELELLQRTLEPAELAQQRRRDAKVFLKALQERDDAVTARIEKLKAARLAVEAAAPAAVAAKPEPAKTAGGGKAGRPATRRAAAGKTGAESEG